MTVRHFQRVVAHTVACCVAGLTLGGGWGSSAAHADGPVVKLVTQAASPEAGARSGGPLVKLVTPVGIPAPVVSEPTKLAPPALPLGALIKPTPVVSQAAAEEPALVEAPLAEEAPTPARPLVSVMVPRPERAPVRVAERVPVIVEAEPLDPAPRPAPSARPAPPAPIEVPVRIAQVPEPETAPVVLGPAPPPPGPVQYSAQQPILVNQAIAHDGTRLDCPTPEQVRCGVYCNGGTCPHDEPSWLASRPIPWQVFAQGEYVGPSRISHVPEYRLRVDDNVEFIYRLTAAKASKPYRLEVGDKIKVQSLATSVAEQEVAIQPDGTVSLSLLGQVPAAGRTVDDLRTALDEMYSKFVKTPNMVIVPLKFNTRLDELRASVDARGGRGGQRQDARVTPEGTVQLPALGSVFVQGLTLNEAKREVDERYSQLVDGLDVTPVLVSRAPRYVFVLGEVRTPGRYSLEGPTTAMQAIAMAGSWNVGADLKHLVVFRRDDCWQLMATKLNLHGAMFGKKPCPTDEIWLRDSDIVLVPKSAMLATDDALSLLFTRGIYAVMPLTAQLNFSKLSTL